MNFQFNIPNKNSELLDTGGDSYYVKQIFDPDEIPTQLKITRQAALNQDAFYVFDHFDTYFSIIENAENVTVNILLRSFDLLSMTSEKLERILSNFFKNNDNLNAPNLNSYTNLTKMTLYLLIGTVKSIDHVILKAQTESGQLKKSKKVDVEGFEGQNWEEKRFNFLVQLYNIIQLPLEKLWSPPVAEEDFVNMFCDICYRSLEIFFAKDKKTCDTIFQILGVAIKRYNHAMTFPVRVLQILRSDKAENAINPIATGIHLLYEEFGIQSIFSVLVDDIIETLRYESGDAQTAKQLSAFFTELSSVSPDLLTPHLQTLAEELLNCESYSLRNCILQIIGNVIVNKFTSEDLAEELKETRNDFLDDLLNHITDIHANVRSKVLQIWTFMKEKNAVPLAFQHKVLQATVERLDDKTIPVRKNAVVLIKSFLENNPFADKLTLAELIEKHEKEVEELDKIQNIMAKENEKIAELDKEWETVLPELGPILEEHLRENKEINVTNSQGNGNYDDLVKNISTLLVEKKYKEAIELVIKTDNVAGNAELRSLLQFDELCTYFMALLKSYVFINHGCKDVNEEFVTQQNTVKFLEDSIEFSKMITKAVPKIQNMLMSKSNTDVFEAVDFFTTAYLFRIKDTENGMKSMLYLIWSGDKEKRDAVINAYKRVLFPDDQQGRAYAVKVVQNLSSFLEVLTHGQYSAMEVLIKEWVENDDINPQIIQVLFEKFTMKLDGTTENESVLALQLLVIASSKKSSITTANKDVIENIGLGERGLRNSKIYSLCLEFLSNSIPSHLTSKFYKRYEQDNPIIEKILNIFKKFFFFPNIHDFDKIATRTIDFFYKLCQAPDVICQNLIIDLHKKLKEISAKLSKTSRSTTSSPMSVQSQVSQQQENKLTCTFLLTRFIFLTGYITMKEMIFLDVDVYNNMKYREELKEMNQNIKKRIHKRRTAHLDMSASESLKRLSGSAAEPQQEPDEDLVGAIAEDNIAELINYICEEELLYSPDGILTKIIPVVVEICKYPSKYNDEHLQQATSLCLLRFMSVSSKFCETYMPFVMNIFKQNDNIKIKCNIIVGLSDLTFRFPNIIEPWTNHIFSSLHEDNDEIRLTAVKMISHLILNEMIRVKSQISDLAICIVDNNEKIKNITQQFFKELANKPNTLYNVIPDIISKLSDGNLNLEEGKYRIIMKYILSLIHKDRQIESLIEKLCLRFNVTYEERRWRDIAYCLSLLNYSEKSIKKLIDNIQHFKDKIQTDEVYQLFKSIITNTSKFAKPELKAAVAEFENRLNECLKTNDDDNQELKENSKKVATRGKQKQKKKQISSSEENSSSSSSSSSSSDNDDDKQVPQQKRKQQQKRQLQQKQGKSKRPQPQVIEEFESTDEDSPVNKRGRPLRNKRK